jgi:hypothetical protein
MRPQEMLYRIIAAEIAWLGSGGGCGCATCRRRDEAAAARRATRAGTGGRALPGWRGWTPPVALRDIAAARAAARRGAPVPPRLRPFLATGRPQVYRITRAGIDRARPLTIGMTDRRAVADRLADHYRRPHRADPQVHRALRNLQPGQILVQVGRLAGRNMTVRRAHGYEIWLQDRERPLILNPDTRTFETAAPSRRRLNGGNHAAFV